MSDPDAGTVYVAEHAAFEHSLLAEHPGFGTLLDEAVAFTGSAWWRDKVKGYGTVEFEPIRSTTLGGDACSARREVRLATNASRFVVAHELAHILHGAMGLSGDAHGLNFRNVYVVVTNRIYGSMYGKLLHASFEDHSLRMSTYRGSAFAPVVDIDAIAGEARGGWAPGR